MKLLYFVIQMDQLGGVARIVSDKVNWLVEHGYEVTVCDIENWEMTPYYELDPRVKFRIGGMQTTPGGIWTRLKGVIRAVKKVRNVIGEERPDVIVNAHCPLVTWVLPFLKVEGLWFKVYGKHKRPLLIAEMHQSRQGLEVFNRKFMSPVGRWLHRWSIRWIYGKYDRFVVLTNGDREQWRLKNCVTIPNFVEKKSRTELTEFTDYDKIAKSDNYKNSDKLSVSEEKQIIMLARLMPQKRIDLMIRAWAMVADDFPNWKVKVLGEGMERENLGALTTELGVQDSFLMPGGVKDVCPELSRSSILCLTSEYEGFGIVLIEAMQAGVPVMAMEYVGVHDIICDVKDGYIVPFGDVKAYAERLRTLMSHPEERRRLAENARISVKKFEKEHVMKQWVELLKSSEF